MNEDDGVYDDYCFSSIVWVVCGFFVWHYCSR